ncbi:MAG TPA: ribonuclease HII, partial [Candidatus Obscuribacterales bacterium]
CLLASAIASLLRGAQFAEVVKPLLLTNSAVTPEPSNLLVAGVDEVGRGCLFGPVVSCALVLNPSNVEELIAAGVTDSKKIKEPSLRSRLASLIKEACLDWRIGIGKVSEIDSLNILNASLLSMRRAISKLAVKPELVLVDGNQLIPDLDIPQQAIVGGDKSEIAIAAASIVAKVWRDELMVRLAQKYPNYGIEKHKGYGTASHLAALNKLSPTRLHRTSFSPVQAALDNQKNFQSFKNFVEEPIMSEATISQPVETVEVPATPTQPEQQRKNRQNRNVKVRHLNILESPELEPEANAVVKSSFDRMKTTFMGMIEEGRRLIDIKFSLHILHGEEKGEKKFLGWLSSQDWGGLGKSWAASAVQLAEWWMTLPKHVQEWLPSNIQGWSAAAIARLPVASAISHNFMLALVGRGKQSAQKCDRALKSAKLKTDDYAVVVCADPWKGEIGKVTEIAKDKTITLEFPGGVTKSFAPEKIEKWTAEVPEIAIGSRVIVSGDQTWNGAIATVVGKAQPNGWWVVLDKISASGSTTKNLFKTAQLSLRTSEQVFAAPEQAATEADWQDINRLYKLSPENQDSVREQAILAASDNTDADGVVNVSLGHIQQVLNDYGFKSDTCNSTGKSAKKNSNQAVYTEADFAAERAKWEEEKKLLEEQIENRVRAELTLGLQSELREQAEQKVRQELAAAKAHASELSAKYQQALVTIESVKEQVAQVNQLTGKIDALTKENESLKQQMYEQVASPDRWQKNFAEQAGKVINSELEAKYEPLVQKLEEMSTKVQQQEE